MPISYSDYKKKHQDAIEKKRKRKSVEIPINYNRVKKEEKKEKNSWFNTSAFDDGYQFGDIGKSVSNTIKDVKQDAIKGILGIGEGVVDAGAYVVGGTAKAFGNDKFADKTEKFISKNFIEDSKIANVLTNVASPYDLGNIVGQSLRDEEKSFSKSFTDRILSEDFEEESLLGNKSDSLVQSAGQLAGTIGLQAAGVPWWLTTSTTSFGKGTSEAFSNGATYGEAGAYGLISAAAETLTEKLSGGISFGGKTLDDVMLKPLTEKITNKTIKTLTKFGLDAIGEGGEEVLTEVITNVGKKLTYEDEKTLSELLTSEEAMEGYLDAFIGGAVLGGGFNVGRAANSIKTGRDYDTGLSTNEQKVIDKEVENRIAEAEKEGKKLTNKQKNKIQEEVKQDLEKGYISLDTIESTLGGETYNKYKSLTDKKKSLESEIQALEGKKLTEFTVKDNERLQDLRKQLSEIDTDSIKSQLSTEVDSLTQNDAYLRTSYNEKANKGVNFQADVSKYDAKQQKIVQKAIDSGILNNTNKTHDFVDMIAKISADKGVDFDFTNNENLKNSGFAVEGKTVNGFVKDGSITLNVESNKALNKVVGHEITHVLEGTEVYSELQEMVKQYATTKGEYQTRFDELSNLYKDVEDANIENELTADLVGDYLFNDPDFVKNLSVEKPTIFKKIFNEIKHLYKLATAGSKEAKQLEKVKKAFEDAYRENGQVSENTKFNIENIGKFDQKEYNNVNELILPEKEYGRLAHIVDSDPNITPGINKVKLSDKTYDIYYKEYNKFKVLDVYGTVDYDGGDIDGVNDITKGTNTRVEATRSEQGYSQFSNAEIENRTTTTGNDGVSNNNKGQNNKQEYSDTESIGNQKQELDDSSFFNTKFSLDYKSVDEQLYDKYSERVDNGYNVVNEYKKKYEEATNTEEFKNAISRIVKEGIKLDSEIYKNEIAPAFEKADKIKEGLDYWQEQLNKDKAKLDEIAKKLDEIEESNKPKLSPEEIVKKAEEHFGTTNNFKETAYIDINGKQIDFSGKHEGGPSGVRTLDHRQINEIDTDMDSFINMGNIRILPEGGGINLATEPNKAQYNKLYDYITSVDGEIYIDVDKADGTYDSAEYKAGTSPSKIVNDLKIYFKTGSFPKQSEFAQFRYSLTKENQDIAPSRGDIYGSDIKLQVEEAIAPIKEDIAKLQESLQPVVQQVETNSTTEDYSNTLTDEDLPYFEQQYQEDVKNLPELDIPIEVEQYNDVQEVTSSMDDRSIKMMSKNIKKHLGLNKVQTEQFEKTIKELSKNANLTQEDVLDYLEDNFGTYSYKLLNDEISEAQAELRSMRVNVSPIVQSDIRDYYKLKQQNFGKIRFSKEGLGVDQNYQELSSKYPDLFPSEIYNESDQFLRMVEIANMDKFTQINEDVDLQEEAEFIYDSILDYRYNDSLQASDRALAEARNYYKNAEAPVDANEEVAPVKKLNRPEGEFKNKDVEPIDLDKSKQLTIDGTEEDLVTKTKRELRTKLLGTEAQKEFILNALDNAKNRSMALMNNTDTIRNTELVFGRDAGNVINEVVFQKEIDNEADSIAWQNQERQEIKDLGIKARSKESAAVQKYGEKQYVEDNGKVVSYTEEDLAREFPNVETQNKIKNAARVIRQKYDAYIDEANNVLTKLGFDPIKKRNDYMRHFQELNDVFSRYGIPFNAQNMQEHTLPTDINGLTEFWSPQKNYFANMQPRKGMKTTYDAVTGIDGYIGGIANLIYHTEDIQRGRAFEELIRETYGEDKGFENLDNLPEDLQQARIEKIQDNHLSNYAAWVHEWTNNIAGKKNKIDRSVESMFGRKAFTVLDEVRKQVGSNMIGLNLSSSLTNLIAPVQAMAKTNKLAVAKGTADTIKNMFVKDNFMDNNKFLTARMGTDMISKNAWQKVQDAGFIFMKGMDWFSSNQIVRSKYYELRAKGYSEADAHAEAGQFAARILGDRTKGANAQLYNSKLVGLVTQFQLEVNNQLYSMFYDTYHESKENARGNALKTAAGMTFTLGQLFAFTHLFGQTFESIAGYNPTFDIVEMLKTALGWGEDDEEEETTISERLKKSADMLVDALPYVNILTGGGRIPVASGIPNLVSVATGGKDEYGNEVTLEDELKKLLFLVPPTGGNQLKKTTQGLGMFDDELPVKGSYTDSGNLRYPVEDTPLNRVQAALFGQYANENASNYFDNERQSLKSKQIQEFADLDIPIADYWDYREGLKEQKTTQEKFDYINSLDVTDEQKNIMINNAINRKEEVDMSNYGDYGSYEEFDCAYKNPEKYKLITQIDTFDNYNTYKETIADIKEQYSKDNGYSTEERKHLVQEYINSLNLSVPQKIMLQKAAGGYSIKNYEDYIYQYVNSLDMTAEEKQMIHDQLFK